MWFKRPKQRNSTYTSEHDDSTISNTELSDLTHVDTDATRTVASEQRGRSQAPLFIEDIYPDYGNEATIQSTRSLRASQKPRPKRWRGKARNPKHLYRENRIMTTVSEKRPLMDALNEVSRGRSRKISYMAQCNAFFCIMLTILTIASKYWHGGRTWVALTVYTIVYFLSTAGLAFTQVKTDQVSLDIVERITNMGSIAPYAPGQYFGFSALVRGVFDLAVFFYVLACIMWLLGIVSDNCPGVLPSGKIAKITGNVSPGYDWYVAGLGLLVCHCITIGGYIALTVRHITRLVNELEQPYN